MHARIVIQLLHTSFATPQWLWCAVEYRVAAFEVTGRKTTAVSSVTFCYVLKTTRKESSKF